MSFLLPLCDSVLVIAFALLLRRDELRLTHPALAYLAYHFFTVTLRLWGLFWGAPFGFQFFYSPTNQDFFRAFLISDIGLIAIGFGFWLGRAYEVKPVRAGVPLSRNLVLAVALVAGVLSIGGSLTFEDYYGINNAREVTIIDGRNIDVNGYETSTTLWLIPSLILLVYRFGPRKPLLVLLSAAIVVRLYTGWNRFSFLLPTIVACAVLLEQAGRKWPTIKQVFVGLAIFAVFSAGKGFVRTVVDVGWDENTLPEALARLQDNLTGNGEIGFFDQSVIVAAAIPERAGYLLGRNYYLPFVMWVPRVYWQDKPGFAEELHQLSVQSGFPMEDIGMVQTFHGANYANFGFFGVILIGIPMGWVCMRLFCRAYACSYGSAQRLMYILFWGCLLQIFRDGLMGMPILLYNMGFPIYLAGITCLIGAFFARWLGHQPPQKVRLSLEPK